jgi:hypothetical protein
MGAQMHQEEARLFDNQTVSSTRAPTNIKVGAHSAACPGIVVDRGIFQYALGFNLLDFRAAEIVNLKEAPTRFDDDGFWDEYKWPLTLEIAELSADRDIAERYRGSRRFPGVVKSHEQFFCGRGILGGREIGDWADAEVDDGGQFLKELASKLNKGARAIQEARQFGSFSTTTGNLHNRRNAWFPKNPSRATPEATPGMENSPSFLQFLFFERCSITLALIVH